MHPNSSIASSSVQGNTALKVWLANKEDASRLSDLMQDMARFDGVDPRTHSAMEQYIRSLPPGIEFLVAVECGTELAVGFAAFATLAPGPNLEPQLFLKNLYVPSAARLPEAGRLLLQELARLARSRGYSRVDWAVESGNAEERALYDVIGGRPIDRVYYRLDGVALNELAEGAA